VKKFEVGDRVKFNSHCGTEYLRDRSAVVTEVGQARITVAFEEPIGRFVRVENGLAKPVEVEVPPTIVDLVK
jgi:hypothetical protein